MKYLILILLFTSCTLQEYGSVIDFAYLDSGGDYGMFAEKLVITDTVKIPLTTITGEYFLDSCDALVGTALTLSDEDDELSIGWDPPEVFTLLYFEMMEEYIESCKGETDTLWPVSDPSVIPDSTMFQNAYVSVVFMKGEAYYQLTTNYEEPTFLGFYNYLKTKS